MLRVLFTLLFGLSTYLVGNAGTMVLEGNYQGKNLYVVNSVSGSGVGYCVFEVLVNGKISPDEWNSPAFQIDLSVHGLKLGDDVIVTIKYKEGCIPKVINPGVLEPEPSFEIEEIDISQSGLLSWKTKSESGSLPYIVQQFKWNKWVNVGEVQGKGVPGLNNYSFQTVEISGANKFRVVQKDAEGESRSSEAVSYSSSKTPILVSYQKKSKSLNFTGDTNYEIYNVYGQIVKRGFGSSADVSSLPKNEYYVNFDNTYDIFFRD